MVNESNMLSDTDMRILAELRGKGRHTFTEMSQTLGIGISTVFDSVRKMESEGVIRQYTCLPDWGKLGFSVHTLMLLKAPKEVFPEIEERLKACPRVNGLARLKGDFCLVVEGLFEDTAELERFLEDLRKGFKGEELHVLRVLEELKREGIMSNCHPKSEGGEK
jgi:DNA-binding Lrp family transcriptional regulator